jgi:hypothetical protein
LSAALASRRRAAQLTQPQLAELADVSVTTIGHAETGRLWQSRRFWEHADKALNADRELLALHDAYRDALPVDEDTDASTVAIPGRPVSVATSGLVAAVTITWANGMVSTIYPPQAPARSATATPDR